MRVAILSDIHGNTIALDAVLADIERQGGVDGYWILGDFAALGYAPVGVLERISQLPGLVCTRGNTDRYLVTGERPFPSISDAQSDPNLIPKIVEMNASFAWTQGAVTTTGWLDWLANLPLEFRITLPDGTQFLGVHAAPGTDDGPGLYPALAEADITATLASTQANLICVGHTHEVMDVVVNGRHLINLGSVSNPKAPDLRASYALLTADPHGHIIEHHYVEYDREAVIAALEVVRHPGRTFISKFMRGEIQPTG
jgi:predicted phosphodiesterase